MARDPSRIDPIIDKLRAAWLAHPDMRLGQIVANSNMSEANVFYAEDHEFDFAWCDKQQRPHE